VPGGLPARGQGTSSLLVSRIARHPHRTYAMTEADVDRWREQFQVPDAAELGAGQSQRHLASRASRDHGSGARPRNLGIHRWGNDDRARRSTRESPAILTPFDEIPAHQTPYPLGVPASTDVAFDDGYCFGVFSADQARVRAGQRGHSGNPASALHSGTHAPSAELCRFGSRRRLRRRWLGTSGCLLALGEARPPCAEPQRRGSQMDTAHSAYRPGSVPLTAPSRSVPAHSDQTPG
jgi:hypothetical protein